MAKRKKTGGRNFQPGQSGNPNGGPKLPEDVKLARKMTRVELERLLNRYMHASRTEIDQAVANPETPMLELMIATLIQKGVMDGDYKRLSFLLDRLGFVVTERVEISGKDGGPLEVSMLSEEQLKRMAEEVLK